MLLIVGLGAVVIVAYLATSFAQARGEDLEVYRGAILTWLHGGDLYSFQLAVPGFTLPFTYPPFAALVMLPSALISESSAVGLMFVASAVLVVLIAAMLLQRSELAKRPILPDKVLLAGVGAVGLGWSDAAIHGVALGQVSLLLATAVLVDTLVLPPRWRGVLIGLAAAIKLTPLVFIGYLLVSRQWRASLVAGATALGATVLGFVVLPGPSLQYWGSLLWQTGRVGDTDAVRNKSLLGLLAHLGVGDHRMLIWVAAALVVAIVGLWRAVQAHRRGDELAAVLVVGMLSALVSPISWTHHLLWLPIAGVYLAYLGGPWPRVLGILIVAGFGSLSPLISYQSTGSAIGDALGDTAVFTMLAFVLFGLPRSTATTATARGD